MKRENIHLPQDVVWLLQTLHHAGYSAYVVGGCVRDSLLGRRPGDWDICTAARPDQMRALFADRQLILTGEKHGTVGVVLHGIPYEITTYRLDGNYQDHRHPDRVQFVGELAQDLARRDFTINAMAYAPGEGVIDLYGGRRDLAAGIIHCVGNPEARFAEDALRILRALRFSARLGFTLEAGTENRRPGCPGQSAIGQRGADLCRTGRPADGPVCGQDAGNLWRNSGRRRAGSGALHRLHTAGALALLRCVAAHSGGGYGAGSARPGYPGRPGAALGHFLT